MNEYEELMEEVESMEEAPKRRGRPKKVQEEPKPAAKKVEAKKESKTSSAAQKPTSKRVGIIVRKHCIGGYEFKNLRDAADECYQNGFCGDDVIKYIENKLSVDKKSRFLLITEKMRNEYRSEPLFMMTVLYNGLVRSNEDFVNVGFM